MHMQVYEYATRIRVIFYLYYKETSWFAIHDATFAVTSRGLNLPTSVKWLR